MIDLKEQLLADLKEAMKNKDIISKNTIQLLRACILNKEKDLQCELSDNQILEIVASEIKKRKDTLKIYKERQIEEQILQISKEIEVLNRYMPKQLTEDELTLIVYKWVDFFKPNEKQNMGAIIKKVKEEVGVRAEGRIISQKVKELIK
jgi:hypothetical protein